MVTDNLELKSVLNKIDEILTEAAQVDCEHGVCSLNAQATKEYLQDYPATLEAHDKIYKILSTYLDEGDAYDGQQNETSS